MASSMSVERDGSDWDQIQWQVPGIMDRGQGGVTREWDKVVMLLRFRPVGNR